MQRPQREIPLCHPFVVPADTCAAWLSRIGEEAGKLSEYSSSLRLKSIPGISPLPLIANTGIRSWCEDALNGPVVCDLDECWVRRQYAPKNYPPRHAPHSWHQDGALRVKFTPGYREEDALAESLESVTCWIALTACGIDAPGLELITKSPAALVAPVNLTEERIRRRFAPEDFRAPAMQAGDALLFAGNVLHRTYVNASMTEDRTSIELRFFPAGRLPDRLHGDEFVSLGPCS